MNRVTKHLGTKFPIIQAPMGWIARSQLASAVSNAGGLGMIETSSGEVDACKEEIKKMSSLTDQPFGVNLPILFLLHGRYLFQKKALTYLLKLIYLHLYYLI